MYSERDQETGLFLAEPGLGWACSAAQGFKPNRFVNRSCLPTPQQGAKEGRRWAKHPCPLTLGLLPEENTCRCQIVRQESRGAKLNCDLAHLPSCSSALSVMLPEASCHSSTLQHAPLSPLSLFLLACPLPAAKHAKHPKASIYTQKAAPSPRKERGRGGCPLPQALIPALDPGALHPTWSILKARHRRAT